MFYGSMGAILSSGQDFKASEVYGLWQNANTRNAGVTKIQIALVDIGALAPLTSDGKPNIDGFWGPITSAALEKATGSSTVTSAALEKLEAKLAQAKTPGAPPLADESKSSWVRTALWIGVPVVLVAGLAFAFWPKAKKRPALENRRARRNRRSKKYACPVCGEKSHSGIACDCATV